ncbi:transcriptional regulator [Burkholderia anthina]|uniref:transcriptional regulator n=1 Tax=Burkholderia anthina TaxID=179879 RepID=UPI001FC8A016|nr:transcriptional regulator [Burkholderia anthina]
MATKVNSAHPAGGAKPDCSMRRVRQTLPLLPNIDQFPETGYSRWVDARPFVRRSREWVRQKEAAGLFPRGIRASQNEKLWPNAELKRWLRDPLAYRADQNLVDHRAEG